MEVKPLFDANSVRIVALNGSLRPGSYTARLLETALIGATELGAETELINLQQYDLPFCDGRPSADYPETVHALRGLVKSAHGILLGTPEYHGSMSGVLKNALDLMGFEQFEGKIVGLVGVAGGGMGAINALNALRIVGRSLRAWVLPQQVSLPRAHELFNEEGYLKSGHLEERVLEVGREVARFAYLHHSQKFSEFMQLWEQAQRNPGGD